MNTNAVSVWDLIDPGAERRDKVAENFRVYRDAAAKLYAIVGDNGPYNVDLEDRLHDDPELDALKRNYINTMRETMAEVIRVFYEIALEVAAKGLNGQITESSLNHEWMQIIFGPDLLADSYVQELLGAHLLEFLQAIKAKQF